MADALIEQTGLCARQVPHVPKRSIDIPPELTIVRIDLRAQSVKFAHSILDTAAIDIRTIAAELSVPAALAIIGLLLATGLARLLAVLLTILLTILLPILLRG